MAASLLLLCSMLASAQDFKVNGIYYRVTDTALMTVEVVYPYDYDPANPIQGSVTIPSTVKYGIRNYTVTSIGECAFQYTELTEIKLSEGISSIGRCAFVGCKNLKKVTLPSSLSYIGEDAFGTEYDYGNDYSVSLNEVHISDFAAWCQIYFENTRSNPCCYLSNTENFLLNGKAVANERRLVIPDGVTCINNYALTIFYPSILEIPQSVQYIGENNLRPCCIVNMSDLNIVAGSDEHYNIASNANVVVTKEDIRIGDYFFRTIDGVNNLIAYAGSDSDIELPADCLGESYEIGYKAFASYYWLENVKIPYGVTSIGEYAFQHSNLQQIVLPNSVTSIGYRAFEQCFIGSIIIPSSVKTIENEAFYSASLWDMISMIPADELFEISADAIGSQAKNFTLHVPEGSKETYSVTSGWDLFHIEEFAEIDGLIYWVSSEKNATATVGGCLETKTTLQIQDKIEISGKTYDVTSIQSSAFFDCKNITSITIPEGVTYIGNNAFNGCISLVNVTLPETLETIGRKAFYGCTALTTITIPQGVDKIHDYTFYGCTNLADIIIPDNLTTFGYKVFDGTAWHNAQSDGLIYVNNILFAYKGEVPDNTTLIIKNGTVGISDRVFENCDGLTAIEIPNSVTSIGENAFYNCDGLTAVYINDIAAWCNIDFKNYSSNPLYYAKNLHLDGELVTNLIIPNGVTEIKGLAFYNCTGLANVTIGNNVTSIGKCAFYGCTGLANVTIGNNVTSIGGSAFDGCTGLANVTIGNSVTSIGGFAFYNCIRLTGVKIPNSVTSIGNRAFDGCSSLTAVHVNDIAAWCNIDFENLSSNPLYYAKNLYLDDKFITELIIPEGVKEIKSFAFCYCTSLTSVTIPNSVTSMGNCAFKRCYDLLAIEIPNSVTSIGDNAFEGCYDLTAVHINDIAAWCNIDFEGISSNPLYYAKNQHLDGELVTNLIIPDGVTEIKGRAFSGCTGLTSVTIPNSVTSIGSSAFLRCDSLTAVHINDIVAWCNIDFGGYDSNPLYYAKNLYIDGKLITELIIPESVTEIKGRAFYNCTGLTGIEIPNSVTSIGRNAFDGCTGLTSVTIPNSVTSIGTWAFSDCSGLTSVTISNSVTSIGSYAFYGCTGLTEVYVNAKTPPTINSSTFNDYSATLYLPYGTKAAYQAADYWKNFTNIVEMEPDALPGDVNEDDRVSVADITTVVDAILNESTDTAYDVNGDSRVSVADITTIVDIILNEGASAASKAPARVATRSTSALSLYIDPFEINAGEEKDILVNLSNPGTEITAVEFDLFLPAGLEVVSDEYGYYISPGSRTPNKRNQHAVTGDLMSSGAIHVICYHNSQLAFTGEDGDVVAITIKAADDLEPGNYTIDLKNIELVNPADPKNGILISDSNTVATDIENIEAEEEGTTVIYDLSGRKVAEPVKGGIYIINGKKVVF